MSRPSFDRHDIAFDPAAARGTHAFLARLVVRGLSKVRRLVRGSRTFGRPQANERFVFDGYDSGDAARVDAQCRALYEALCQQHLSYLPEDWGRSGAPQRIRLADEVLRERGGCCLDLTLLLATMAAQVSLDPLIVIVGHDRTPRHALFGYWTADTPQNRGAGHPVLGPDELRAAGPDIALIDVVRCTDVQEGGDLAASDSYLQARQAATDRLYTGELLYAIDVRACWMHGIEPFRPDDLEPYRRVARNVALSAAALAVVLAVSHRIVTLQGAPESAPVDVHLPAPQLVPGVEPTPQPSRQQGPGAQPAPAPLPALAGVFVAMPDGPSIPERLLVGRVRGELSVRGVAPGRNASDALVTISVQVTATLSDDPASTKKRADLFVTLEWTDRSGPNPVSQLETFTSAVTNTTINAALANTVDDLAVRIADYFQASGRPAVFHTTATPTQQNGDVK